MFQIFNGKKVLVTGHTGFKGAWLTAWLHTLGARVVGVALPDLPTSPSHFAAARLDEDARGRHLFHDMETQKRLTDDDFVPIAQCVTLPWG